MPQQKSYEKIDNETNLIENMMNPIESTTYNIIYKGVCELGCEG